MVDHRNVIVQFGTSRFLQAHVDLFASEAAATGQTVPPIIVVQTTRDRARAGARRHSVQSAAIRYGSEGVVRMAR